MSMPGTLDTPPPPAASSSPAASAPASSLLMRIARWRHATAAAPFAFTLGIVPKTWIDRCRGGPVLGHQIWVALREAEELKGGEKIQ